MMMMNFLAKLLFIKKLLRKTLSQLKEFGEQNCKLVRRSGLLTIVAKLSIVDAYKVEADFGSDK